MLAIEILQNVCVIMCYNLLLSNKGRVRRKTMDPGRIVRRIGFRPSDPIRLDLQEI